MQFDRLKRREFITLLGGAAAWPIAARAQQSAMPVIGFLDPRSSSESFADQLRGFHRGLREIGYVEGQNVAIDFRFAENQFDRLETLAAELVRRQVAVIVASGGSRPTLAAKWATTTVPIVFAVSEDPIGLGLVTSLARPGTNLTGINFFNSELTAKRMEFLRALVPGLARVAVLVNPNGTRTKEAILRDVEPAARSMALQIQVFGASTSRELDAAFEDFARERPDALFVAADAFFHSRRVQISTLAAHDALPATYAQREYVEAGGLMSYGTNLPDTYRQMGIYCGRILNGANPADLPVVQSIKFELVVNLTTAKALGLTVPPTLLALADDVID